MKIYMDKLVFEKFDEFFMWYIKTGNVQSFLNLNCIGIS